jgi:hypothetical protein
MEKRTAVKNVENGRSKKIKTNEATAPETPRSIDCTEN